MRRSATAAASLRTTHRARATAGQRRALPIEPEIARLQRARLLAAAEQVVEEAGYAQLTVGRVIQRARVSRKTFYEIFANREDCFLAVLEQAVDTVRVAAVQAYLRQASWRAGVRAALEAALVSMDEDRSLARTCIVESLGVGPRVLQFRVLMLRELADAFDLGRVAPAALYDPPPVTGEAIAGSLVSVLFNRLCGKPDEPLTDLLGPLMSIVTLPYLGAGVASAELSRPKTGQRTARRRRTAKQADPLSGLEIRLTRRTARVLMAIAERPGVSNREVACRAGIADEGQVSKLLRRLARLALIENTGPGQSQGGPNAWRLSDRGERLSALPARFERAGAEP